VAQADVVIGKKNDGDGMRWFSWLTSSAANTLVDPVSGRKLYPIDGGIAFPDYHKQETADIPIRNVAMPSHYIVPLRVNPRFTARPIVDIGARVRKGEKIGEPEGKFGVAVHAPTSGVIRDLGHYPMTHVSGLPALAYFIEPDGKDEAIEPTPYRGACDDTDRIRDFLQQMGLAGLGGAAFPSHAKVASSPVKTLIINGAECEPWITCDDRLMREHAAEIVAGACDLAAAVHALEVLIGIEDNKPQAIAAMQAAAANHGAVTVVAIPTIYPAGGEKQLIERLTGIEVPYGHLSAEFGVLVFNVGTARAVHRALTYGEPLLERVVTLTGAADDPGNRWVRIGHPIAELILEMAPKPEVDRYLLGGPMTGFAIPDLDAPILKGSNCIIAASPALFPPPPPEQPCIRCGACAPVCPARLEPMALYWFARAQQFGKAQEFHLFDCIECGCCAYVCPAHIPLVDYYRYAKSEIWEREREKSKAQQSKARFEFRNYRLEREKAEKAARAAAKAAETKRRLEAQAQESHAEASANGTNDRDGAASPSAPNANDAAARKKALVEAALARARAKRAAEATEPSGENRE